MTRDQATAVLEAAIPVAREFFLLDPRWDVRFHFVEESPQGLEVEVKAQYFKANIACAPIIYDRVADLWRDVGHEIAHIATAELITLERYLKAHLELDEEDSPPSLLKAYFGDAIESVTSRLEAMFAKERPCPLEEFEVRRKVSK